MRRWNDETKRRREAQSDGERVMFNDLVSEERERIIEDGQITKSKGYWNETSLWSTER